MNRKHLSRRRFVQGTAAVAAAAVVTPKALAGSGVAGQPFASDFSASPDRVWIGREYWANPLQDWRLAGGRVECVNAALDRSVHLLTRAVSAGAGKTTSDL